LAEEYPELEERGRSYKAPEVPPEPVRSREYGERPPRPFKRRPRQFMQRRVCGFCVDKATHIDYKDTGALHRYITERGRIQPRRKTGTCAKHQRALARAIKRARYMALLPYTEEHVRLHMR
jgi:small subunit ribosomal protein S18